MEDNNDEADGGGHALICFRIHEGVWEYMAGRGYVWGSGEMNAANQLRI